MSRGSALAVAFLAPLLAAACSDAPPPTVDPTAPRSPTIAPTTPEVDVIVTLVPTDGDHVQVYVDQNDCGSSTDAATWAAVEKHLADWVTAHPEHAKPSVRVDAPPGVGTEAIVGTVNKVMAIGVEHVALHRTPEAAEPSEGADDAAVDVKGPPTLGEGSGGD